jgi:hypothetical protein
MVSMERSTIVNAIRDRLKADTTTLYGATKLLQIIDSDPLDWENRETTLDNYCALYIRSFLLQPVENLMQAYNETYSISLDFVCDQSDLFAAMTKIDQAYQQVKKLLLQEMFNGKMLSQYYTDTKAQIFDIQVIDNDISEVSDQENFIRINSVGNVLIYVNRWE